MKSKTLATWLAFLGGPLGLHRFYLHGARDLLGWLLPLVTGLGMYGIARVQALGHDDPLSWLLVPLLGFTVAGCALRAILYGLTPPARWNARFNPEHPANEAAGASNKYLHYIEMSVSGLFCKDSASEWNDKTKYAVFVFHSRAPPIL